MHSTPEQHKKPNCTESPEIKIKKISQCVAHGSETYTCRLTMQDAHKLHLVHYLYGMFFAKYLCNHVS